MNSGRLRATASPGAVEKGGIQVDRRSEHGFTLLEVVMSLAIVFILFGGVFSLLGETSSFLGDQDAEVSALSEGSRAFQRITEVLRKSGRSSQGGFDYPRVTDSGTGLEFRIPVDLDGNGYAFDGTTGTLEWSAAIFKIGLDNSGTLWIFKNGAPIYLLGRGCEAPFFRTIAQDPSLNLREVRVGFDVRRKTPNAYDTVNHMDGVVLLRN